MPFIWVIPSVLACHCPLPITDARAWLLLLLWLLESYMSTFRPAVSKDPFMSLQSWLACPLLSGSRAHVCHFLSLLEGLPVASRYSRFPWPFPEIKTNLQVQVMKVQAACVQMYMSPCCGAYW